MLGVKSEPEAKGSPARAAPRIFLGATAGRRNSTSRTSFLYFYDGLTCVSTHTTFTHTVAVVHISPVALPCTASLYLAERRLPAIFVHPGLSYIRLYCAHVQ